VRTALVTLVVVLCVGAAAQSPVPPVTVETTYQAVGRWAVTTSSGLDAFGRSYDLWYPSNLGADGFRHPVIAWANGTLTPTARYARLLEHLASWGFVVVAPTSTRTGSGSEILEAVSDLVALSKDPASIFDSKLDLTRVGAMGHSQGAYGVLSAALKSNGLIRTVVPIDLPDMVWLNPFQAADLTALTQPVFFVGGGADWLSTATGLVGYVKHVPGAVVAALLTGASHDAVETTPEAFLGYITAWMMYQLQDDAYAGGAFAGKDAEISSNSAWKVLEPSSSRSRSLDRALRQLVVRVV